MSFKKYIVLILVIVILSISFGVNAATGDSYKISLSASKTSLKEEETVTLILKASDINIQSGEKGIGSYEGTLVYDETVFEEVKMKGNDLWDTPALNERKFTSVRSDGQCTSEDQEIATITLKVKKGAKTGNTKIQITDFGASNGVEDIANSGTEITLKVDKVQDNTGNNGGNTSDTENPDNTVKPGNSINTGSGSNSGNSNSGATNTKNSTTSQISNAKNTSTNNSKLPHTGISSTMIIIILIVTLTGIFSYIKYKRTY